MIKKIQPRLEPFDDFALYNTAAALEDNAEGVAAAIEHIEVSEVPKFLAATPGYYPSTKNLELMVGWCAGRGIPMSQWNLTLAFRQLTGDGSLESAPPPEVPEVENSRGVIQQIGN